MASGRREYGREAHPVRYPAVQERVEADQQAEQRDADGDPVGGPEIPSVIIVDVSSALGGHVCPVVGCVGPV